MDLVNTVHQDDLQCLFSEGIQIWGTTHEVLEEQALKELEIFVEENHGNRDDKATHSAIGTEPQSDNDTLNYDKYFRNLQCKENKNITCDGQPTVNSLNNVVSEDLDFNECNVKPSTSAATKLPTNTTGHVSNYQENSLYEYYEDDDEPNDTGSDYVPSECELSDEDCKPKTSLRINKKSPKRKAKNTGNLTINLLKVSDDALENNYKARLDRYYERLEKELQTLGLQTEGEKEYKKLKGGLKVPKNVWDKLYDYQKEGVYWLWELHQRSSGGLLGDEMGLGKTVQMIVFLHALQYSRYVSQHCRFVGVGPTIIVCPATVINQWVKHFHEWAPEFRVVILHQSGSHQGRKSNLIDEVNKSKGIIVTTYAGILKYKGNLCEYNWQYLILDEGHKIRNPTAKVTIAVKEIRTPHRIMLTGSPMQNNLTELWSLFDFTNPGMLGNLAIFTEHFANPILQGGFVNASPMQEATSLSVASTLKNVISPFLLRRMKNEVSEHIQLPHKSEQVLFCSLTDQQRDIYKDYLMSEQVNNILGRGIKTWRSDNFMKANMLKAITALRKICNHPDLFLYDEEPIQSAEIPTEEKYGYYKRSGKLVVVSALLKIWKKQGHRALLFSQGRLMMKLFDNFLEHQGYKFLKMDGSTSISSRQVLIDKFNKDTSYHVFLLTTRVGGLGVNLTGANRVIIYDPDWNPATDAQAKERAWRIGQEKTVTVYRLLCAGTVEEKMYQRQVWKQLLSNKVLIDPTTNKFFKSSDLFDLFSLPESSQAKPETTNIFRESRVKIQKKMKDKKKVKKKHCTVPSTNSDIIAEKVEFSADKIQAMKDLAQQIAKSMSNKTSKEPQSLANPMKDDSFQKELKEERNRKLKRKQRLKQLTPQELLEYNKCKAAYHEDDKINKIDNKITKGSFDQALEQSSKTATIYRKSTSRHLQKSDLNELITSTSNSNTSIEVTAKVSSDNSKSKKRKKHKESSIDTSGKIDGEDVEGLVKCETKKISKRTKISNEVQDNSILEHLFSKKGVSGALEHESVLNGGKKQQSLKVRTYAEEKALKSLDALKKSKLEQWKW